MNPHPAAPSNVQFIDLSDPVANKYLRLQGGSGLAQRSFATARGEYVPEQPLVLEGFMGKRPADVLWCTPNPIVCLSDRLLDLLRQANLTGWRTYPVVVLDRRKQPLPGYSGFAVVSSAGDIDYEQSPVINEPSPVAGGKAFDYYVGYTFAHQLWDGSDFFWVNGNLIVTERVQALFVQHKIENVQFIPIQDVKVIAPLVAMTRRRQAAEKAAPEANGSTLRGESGG